MKAIILAAGMGKRLLPLTKKKHKSLLILRNKPIIREQVDELKKCGVSNIAVVVGYKKEQIVNELKDSVKYYYNPDYKNTNSVVSLWLARDFMEGDDILVLNGDLLVDPSILEEIIGKKSEFCIVLDIGKWNSDGYKVKVVEDQVVDMGMDLKKEDVAGEYAGITKISKSKLPDVIETLDVYIAERKMNDWYEAALVSMIKQGHEMDFVNAGGRWWIEIDFERDLEKARRYLEE